MNIDEVMKKREQVSALADGQLGGRDFAAAIELAAGDEDARASWHLYHFVGDVLRSSELAACGRDRDFIARFSARLRDEPSAQPMASGSLDAGDLAGEIDLAATRSGQKQQDRFHPSNDSSFRWKLIAGFASLAAVTAIGWNAMGGLQRSPSEERFARSSSMPNGAPVAAMSAAVADATSSMAEAQVMIRDPRLDELLAAHRQLGGTSALQNPSGFLRNATFEGTAR